ARRARREAGSSARTSSCTTASSNSSKSGGGAVEMAGCRAVTPHALAFSLVGWILDLHGWVLLVVVFAVPALEASAFVGFVFPGLAGMAKLRYRTFLLYNLAGGAAWATTFVLLGFVAGDAYRRVADAAGRAGLLLLGFVVVIGAIVVTSRWVAHNPDRVRELRERFGRGGPVAAARARGGRPLSFVVAGF